ncbi:MAG: tRNA epoxyqueuosine(34) reductase QueG [Pseudomonadota bacterium]
MSADLTELVKTEARATGFAAVGITSPTAVPNIADRLRTWLDAGRHGEMAWMADRAAWRGDPSALWPEARSIIMLADSYAPEADPLALLQEPDQASVSVYAQGRDYHDVVKKRLKRLGRWLIDQTGGEIKVFVDTAPVMEKPLAQAAGLGWQGKHTNLVSRNLGSWFFLGAIFTTADLRVDEASEDHCGGCRRCLDVCPTAAFPAPYQLDARRCISYLNIELKGPIPRKMRPLMGNRIYGCDDCLTVCPWNKFAEAAQEAYEARPVLKDPDLKAFARLDDTAFRAAFSGSPIKRIGRARFVRNVLVALGNSGDFGAAELVRGLTLDPEPLVRGAAVWAYSRLVDLPTFVKARRDDPDPDVRAEWDLGMKDLAARSRDRDAAARGAA